MPSGLGTDEAGVRGRGSLDRRLPLMISTLLLVTLAAFGFVAFREVRQTSFDAASVQLKTLVAQTVDLGTRNAAVRADSIRRLASAPQIVEAARRAEDDSASANELDVRRPAADPAVLQSLVLVRSDGTRRTLAGSAPTTVQLTVLDEIISTSGSGDSVITSALFPSDTTVHFWLVAS